ncbi:MAG: M18 family aminopeptidase [Erysipelotrichaceae bacterium]|nr:M18 family aminopeptidase [Erysipelotrichaceae bacterium]
MEKKFQQINEELMAFINRTPNAFNCAANIVEILNSKGYTELKEKDAWHLNAEGRHYIVRNDSSVIAFELGGWSACPAFNIVAAHGDSPSFSIKPGNEILENGFLKLNSNGYGGMIYYSWLDRPLSIAGRVILKKGDKYSSAVVNIDRDLLVIPSQAIHLNREVNEKNNLNPQIDLLPVLAIDEKTGQLKSLIQSQFTDAEVCDFDLLLYNRDQARYWGLNNEFIMAPRLDDLACAFTALKAFLSSKAAINRVYCCFNNEEIGSLTQSGADSTFLSDVLYRICECMKISVYPVLSQSMLVSADNGHALHPNAAGKSDLTNKVMLNKGVVIKHHINYTTDALSSSIFKGICEKACVQYQDFTCRSDLRCGATLGGISLSHVSVTSVDIGLPQLAMHSAVETIGSFDSWQMYEALKIYYQTRINK